MRKQILFLVIPILLVLAVLLGSGRSLAQGPGSSQPQAGLGQGFTYQGQLKDGSGNPITNSCDFTFSLWDDLSAGTQVGGNSTVTGVSVANGYFAALVNAIGEFGANAFTGDARWLEIAVQCSGDAGYTTLTPRQELTAAPYALSLRPGAKVVGSVSGGAVILGQNTAADGTALYAAAPNAIVGDSSSPNYGAIVGRNFATTGAGMGVYGLSASADPNTAGVYGRANAVSGQTYGMYGRSDSPDGTGVYGYASATSGAAHGVVGSTAAPGETGVFTYYSMGVDGYASSPSGPTAGVWGQSASTEGIGVRGWASANSGTTYGVYGLSDSTGGYGVYGVAGATSGTTYGVYGQSDSSSGRGVYGYASATSGGAYGVYGLSDSADSSGVHGTGERGVSGLSESTRGTGVEGIASATSGITRGVYGRTDSPAGFGGRFVVNNFSASSTAVAVSGTTLAPSASSYGVAGDAMSNGVGVGAWSEAGNLIEAYAGTSPGGSLEFYITGVGDVYANGTYNTFKALLGADGQQEVRVLHALQSPEAWSEDVGTAQLVDGQAVVPIEALFAQTVNLNAGYHIFLTPLGDCPLYVAEKAATSFTARALGGLSCAISFDYRILARPLGSEGLRMEKLDVQLDHGTPAREEKP